MKITRVEIIPLKIPLRIPFATSRAIQKDTRPVLVKLHTDGDIVGIGECDPKPHITGETQASVLAVIRDYLAPALTGYEFSEAVDMDRICVRMDEVLISNPSAKAGIDIAAHDALGKLKGVPVHSILGQKQREALTSLGFSDLGSVRDASEEAERHVHGGCTSYKIKVARNWPSDMERIAAVRRIIGPNMELIIDPNQAWTVEESIKILLEFGSDFAACEQPVPWDDRVGLARIAIAVDAPIMADEAVWSPSDASTVIYLKAADMVNIKHLKSGGLHRAMQIAKVLQTAGVPCMIGSTVETGISAAASIHLATACPGLKYLDVAPPTEFILEDVVEGLAWEGSKVKPNDTPGLGVTLKDEVVAKYTIS